MFGLPVFTDPDAYGSIMLGVPFSGTVIAPESLLNLPPTLPTIMLGERECMGS